MRWPGMINHSGLNFLMLMSEKKTTGWPGMIKYAELNFKLI